MVLLYKIVREDEWKTAQKAGVFEGSPDDVRDGFIHFSDESQLRETGAKHFANDAGLLLLTVQDDDVPGFKWEVSRGGVKFPYLYGVLRLEKIRDVAPLSRDDTGHTLF